MTRRRHLFVALSLGALAVASAAAILAMSRGSDATAGASWRPRPESVHGLSVVATARDGRYALRTENGEVGFLPGVNLGATTPGHQPGELAITRRSTTSAGSSRWVTSGSARCGSTRSTLRPSTPNSSATTRQHPDAPALSACRVSTSPTRTYTEKPRGLYDPAVDGAFAEEIADAVEAVHGELARKPHRGRADGPMDGLT